MNYVKLHDFLFDMNYNLHKLLSYEIMYNYNLKTIRGNLRVSRFSQIYRVKQ